MKLTDEIKEWLKKPENSKTILAHKLKYRSTSTIEQWLHRGIVPLREQERVIEIIREPKQ